MIKKIPLTLLFTWGIYCLGWVYIIYLNWALEFLKTHEFSGMQISSFFGLLLSFILGCLVVKGLKL